MELSEARQLLIFGGTFDPPHRAHVVLPEQVRRAIDADLTLYVPAGRSPHKQDRESTPAHHRLAMLELALADQDYARIWRDEIERAEESAPSYTVETLSRLRERIAPQARMRLLIGTDQAVAFDRWREPERILELAEPVVMLRPPESEASFLEHFAIDEQRRAWRQRVVAVEAMDISATEVRRRAAAGQPIADLVGEPVARYIQEHGLYR